MMLSVIIKDIYSRFVGLLISPQNTWQEIYNDNHSMPNIIKNFFVPIIAVTLLLQFALLFSDRNWGQTLLLVFLSGISIIVGTRGAYFIVKEYLTEKVDYPRELALRSTYYTASIFSLFNGMSFVLVGGFLEQLFLAMSFIPLFSLYIGIKNNEGIEQRHKTSLWLINFITIIVLPYALRKMLCILFSISAYNI